jgi:hypothetical protein
MTLAVITQGEVLTVRVYKQYAGFSWANNYEVEATQDIANPSTALEFLATRVLELERGLHLSGIVFDRVAISTYVPDSQPYNPNTVAIFPFSLNGTRVGQGNALPLEACLFVRRNVVFGRDGRLLYRGCLTDTQVSTSNLRSVLLPSAVTSYQNIINNWRSVGLGNEFRLVMASGLPIPTDVRQVVNLQVSEKVVYKKYNNRYFRRNP